MNKFYKSIKLTAFVLVLVSLAGCKKDVDVMDVLNDLANKNLLGYYTYTVVDSAKMQVSKKEYFLNRDNAGNQKGYYRENVSGNGISTDASTPLTWESTKAENNLSMLITATLQDGKTKNIKWADGVVYDNGLTFDKSISNLSNIDVQSKIYKQIMNAEFECSDTTFFDHQEKRNYLGWTTDVAIASTQEEADKQVNAIIEDLETNYHDTIVWYLRFKSKTHKVGTYCHLDTVVVGNDTTFNLVGLAVSEPIEGGYFGITFLKKKTEFEYVQVNDRPSAIIYSSISLKDVNNVKTGSYKWQRSEFSKEHYTKPGKDKDTSIDTLVVFTASEWMVSSLTNQAKFDVLLHGAGDTTFTQTKAGVETQTKAAMKEPYFTLPIADFAEKKDKKGNVHVEFVIGDLVYRKK